MTLLLSRVDDRLIHGQVVIGWGGPLRIDLVVLADDQVAAQDWEQEIYRMALPAGMTAVFATTEAAVAGLEGWCTGSARVILLTGDIATMAALTRARPDLISKINLGGIHHGPGRTERLRYVYLNPDELEQLEALAAEGAGITAQDLPGTRPVPLEELSA